MAGYTPPVRFTVPLMLLVPSAITENAGRRNRVYPEEGPVFMGSFRTFGGTEVEVNGVITIRNTAVIDTWFNPNIASDCRIKLLDDGSMWEIIGTPENIDRRNQFMQFKAEAVKGNG